MSLYTLVPHLQGKCYFYRVWGHKVLCVQCGVLAPQIHGLACGLQLNLAHQSSGDIRMSFKLFISIPASEVCCPESFVSFYFKMVLSGINSTICRSKCSLEDTKILWPEILLRKYSLLGIVHGTIKYYFIFSLLFKESSFWEKSEDWTVFSQRCVFVAW